MLDFSVIKNEKLCDLMRLSARFSALPEADQQQHIAKIKDLSASKQEEVCVYFLESNKDEKLSQADRIKKIYEEFIELENHFKNLLGQEPELKEKEQDHQTMDTLLTKLNHI